MSDTIKFRRNEYGQVVQVIETTVVDEPPFDPAESRRQVAEHAAVIDREQRKLEAYEAYILDNPADNIPAPSPEAPQPMGEPTEVVEVPLQEVPKASVIDHDMLATVVGTPVEPEGSAEPTVEPVVSEEVKVTEEK